MDPPLIPALPDLLASARHVGWATGTGNIAQVMAAARNLSWAEVANRTGGPTVQTLTPTKPNDAEPRSLSAQYGLGAQPLHTDGAHIEDRPPDVVILVSPSPNLTPTLLWSGRVSSLSIDSIPGDAPHGVFLVNAGSHSFFATVRTNGRIRYDPGCMTPCDQRARQIAEHIRAATTNPKKHHWDVADQVLLIDNRQTLHGRAAVAAEDEERAITRAAFRLPVTS